MAGEEARPAPVLSLAGVKILQPVPEEERRYLETRCTFRRVAAGDVLMERFSKGSAVYFLVSGHARVVHFLDGQDEITIANVTDGDALGEISAIDGGAASATVVAEEDCVVAELPMAEFQALIVRRGEVALSLLQRWAAIIRDLDDKVSLVSSIGPEQRVYSELIRLARVEKPGTDRWFVPEDSESPGSRIAGANDARGRRGRDRGDRQPRHRRAPHPRALYQRLQGLEGHDPAGPGTAAAERQASNA